MEYATEISPILLLEIQHFRIVEFPDLNNISGFFEILDIIKICQRQIKGRNFREGFFSHIALTSFTFGHNNSRLRSIIIVTFRLWKFAGGFHNQG